jgi:hypothetical protein
MQAAAMNTTNELLVYNVASGECLVLAENRIPVD